LGYNTYIHGNFAKKKSQNNYLKQKKEEKVRFFTKLEEAEQVLSGELVAVWGFVGEG
jgi:hypothetical protein